MNLAERVQGRRQHARDRRGKGGDPQRAAGRPSGGQSAGRRIELSQHDVGVRGQQDAGVGQADRAGRSLEEHCVGFAFERGQLLRDRWRGEVQRSSRCGDAAVASDGLQRLELANIEHKHSLCIFCSIRCGRFRSIGGIVELVRRLPAPVLVIVTVVLWAVAFPAIRVALETASAVSLSFWRLAGATLCLLVAARIIGRAPPSRRDLPQIALCGATGMAAYQLLLNLGERSVAGRHRQPDRRDRSHLQPAHRQPSARRTNPRQAVAGTGDRVGRVVRSRTVGRRHAVVQPCGRRRAGCGDGAGPVPRRAATAARPLHRARGRDVRDGRGHDHAAADAAMGGAIGSTTRRPARGWPSRSWRSARQRWASSRGPRRWPSCRSAGRPSRCTPCPSSPSVWHGSGWANSPRS